MTGMRWHGRRAAIYELEEVLKGKTVGEDGRGDFGLTSS